MTSVAGAEHRGQAMLETGDAWGLELLAADRTGRQLACERRAGVVRAALGAGAEAAQRCRAVHETADPFTLANRLDVPVIWSAESPLLGAMVRIAQYEPRPLAIRLFTQSVQAIQMAAGPLPVPTIYLAHELFHHLEATALAPVPALARVTLARLGPWTWTSGVQALSEISAYAFAQSLLELPFFPGRLDRVLREVPLRRTHGVSEQGAVRAPAPPAQSGCWGEVRKGGVAPLRV